MSIPNYIPFAKRSEFSARLHSAKSEKRIADGVDAETLRRRALDDARGMILREGCTYTSAGKLDWIVERSVSGRTDQRDISVNGKLFKTCGPRRLPSWLR